ncbi:MAG: helix-turn-helix domain-containing protein [Armatimonadetes bacterium]|nr:helix-turn-helix domain-containing protein [Armatimonadota bacterium]NIM22910.1 helix-turn-helix domain-containing protein [Armatimonadota bacterium]NIM66782.1 helix-turn-helix domain-containing protein [Armatimonadota bacterium]NIM75324.1 helix-turn-helix domain-containing protein [Armatimonadota bacterium]NIN04970.1 helix-turn-helix domain-containing protein [Armatimonadota bacterium]
MTFMRAKRWFSPEFGSWLRERRGSKRQIEYAALLRISPSYLSQMEAGLVPGREVLTQMAQAAGEEPRLWLVAAGHERKSDMPSDSHARVAETPGTYAAGPSTAGLPIKGILRGGSICEPAEGKSGEVFACLTEHAVSADYVVRVEDDSLYPLMLDGDHVAVRKVRAVQPGQIVVAQAGDKKVMKRYGGRKSGQLILQEINPTYPAPSHAPGIKILGIAVWVHREQETLRRFGR